jgi:hypothetical protein
VAPNATEQFNSVSTKATPSPLLVTQQQLSGGQIEEFKVSDHEVVKMKIQKKVGFQPYSMERPFQSVLGKRSFSSMEALATKLEDMRHKVYLPKQNETIEFDKELIDKLLEIEIMKIKPNMDLP